MRFSYTKNLALLSATIVSILGQAFAFAPGKMGHILNLLPNWGNLTFGAIFIGISAAIFFWCLCSRPWNLRSNWLLFIIQMISVTGFFLLRKNVASSTQEFLFLFSGALTLLTLGGILFIHRETQLIESQSPAVDQPEQVAIPDLLPAYQESKTGALREQVALVSRKLNTEKHRTTQMTFLNELSQQLESDLDPPVAAQLAVNMLERALRCSFISLMVLEPTQREFVALATSGNGTGNIASGYRQNTEQGILGRTARLKKTQLINDTSLDPDFNLPRHHKVQAEMVVPILQNHQMRGIIEIGAEAPHAFTNNDVLLVEGVAQELTLAWERSSYNQRLTELIQAGISLATLLDPQAAVQELSLLSRKTLEARFAFITLLDQQGNFSRIASDGDAPRLFNSLKSSPTKEPLIRAALNATKPFRVRDVRKYSAEKNIDIDHGGLRSALAIPIRLHRLSIGAIIVFGKQEGVFFSERDASLADLLASQAAAAIESSWLYQELRNTLNNTSLLYQLSLEVTQTEDLTKAAQLIAQAAHRLATAKETGLILLSKENEIDIEVELDDNGFHTRNGHPRNTIQQAIQMGQSMFISEQQSMLVCYPLLTRTRTIGALWISIPESHGQNFANIQTLANQAAVTLERSSLYAESRRQAKQIEVAYQQLQATYDQTLYALMSALDARDRETEGHSMRVSKLACMMGEILGLNDEELKALERGALLHDIGKIGISDTILHKPAKLTDDEWRIMKTHPDIGARIVDKIPFLQECMPVVYHHHERWDGSGYPLGLKGTDIPLFARIFAVADVYDALTSKRSYRKRSSPDEAVAYLREHANSLFDKDVVKALAQLPYSEFTETEKNSA